MEYSFNPVTAETAQDEMGGLLLFGPPGAGKSSALTYAGRVVLLCTENGVQDSICVGKNVVKVPARGRLEYWEHPSEPSLIGCLRSLVKGNHDRQTVAIDTLGAAEDLCRKHVLKEQFGDDQAAFDSYYKGEAAVKREWKKLIVAFETLQNKGMWVIATAHEVVHRHGNADGPDFHKLGPAISTKLLVETCAWFAWVGRLHRPMIVEAEKAKPGKAQKVGKAVTLGNYVTLTVNGSAAVESKCRAGFETKNMSKFTMVKFCNAHPGRNLPGATEGDSDNE